MGKKSYRDLQNELSEILGSFEQASHQDVDDLLKDYERGMKIIEELEALLKDAELRIKTVKTA